MNFKTIDDVKRFVKSMDVKPVHTNITVLGICEECHLPGIEDDPFAKHAPTCSKAKV